MFCVVSNVLYALSLSQVLCICATRSTILDIDKTNYAVKFKALYLIYFLFQLCAVSLELFYTLVDLNCEDVMLELVLK